MAGIRKILLIDEEQFSTCETELVLKVGAYQLEKSADVREAVNRYQLYRETESRFDLIIAVTDATGRTLLEKLYQERYLDFLILFQRTFSCQKGFCRAGHLAYLCNPTAILTCIEDLQRSSRRPNPISNWPGENFSQLSIAN